MNKEQIIAQLSTHIDAANYMLDAGISGSGHSIILMSDVEALEAAVEAIKENEALKREVVYWMKEANKCK